MGLSKKELQDGALRAFVIMPFHESFDDVYNTIKAAVGAVEADLKVIRLDEIRAAGRITDDLLLELNQANLCIADVSGANENVMWEMGYATALKKPVIALSDNANKLPFDTQDVRTLMYDRSSLVKTLRAPLEEAIRQTIDRYAVATSVLRTRASRPANSIAVTGTMECAPEKARSRISRALEPFLGREASWYLGSFGVFDEQAARFLVEAGEKNINVVGYGAHDISGRMREIVQENQLYFVDAAAEQIPTTTDAPSIRDMIFVTKCDIVFVGWDGVSSGTRQLVDWLAAIKKDHQLVFVPPLFREVSTPLRR